MTEKSRLTNEDLKYCPFCGNKSLSIGTRIRSTSATYWYVATCFECGASSSEHPSLEELVAAWNKRATDLIPSERGGK